MGERSPSCADRFVTPEAAERAHVVSSRAPSRTAGFRLPPGNGGTFELVHTRRRGTTSTWKEYCI